MIVADNETAVDLLYYESVAGTVVRLLSENSKEPLSVGVHGDWGAGKSSVLMMVEEALREQEGVLCVRLEATASVTRRESANDDAPEHAVGARLTARW